MIFRGSSRSLSKVDLDQDGEPDRVARYAMGICDFTRAWETAVLVLNKDREVIDTWKPPDLPSMSVHYDVFVYKESAFLDEWLGESARNVLSVYRLKDGKGRRLCRLRYRKG